MSQISDEELMAYADGELADNVRSRVEAYLANDPNGKTRLAVFSATGRNLADLFDQPMRESVPARLMQAIGAGALQIAPASDAKVFPLRSRRRLSLMAMPTRALAASLAGVLVASSSIWLLENASPDAQSTFGLASANAEKIAGDDLASTLETVPSGKTVERTIASEKALIRPTFSFATQNSSYCRQYDILRQKLTGLTGVACRQPNGSWRIEIQTPSAVHRSSSDTVLPAGKTDLTPVEAIVDGLISGDVLGPDDEARAINSGWHPAPS